MYFCAGRFQNPRRIWLFTSSHAAFKVYYVSGILFAMNFSQAFISQLIIPVIAGLLVALIPFLLPTRKFSKLWHRWVAAGVLLILGTCAVYYLMPGHSQPTDLVIAGNVVDDADGASIRGAQISIVGRSETCVSESNGNFRLVLNSDSVPDRIPLHVEKLGFAPYDVSVIPGVHSLVVQLRRATR